MNKIIANGLICALLGFSGALMAGEKIDEVVETKADGRLYVDVMNGEVVIHTWDRNEVKVTGELDDDAEGYQFDVSGDGRVVFKVEMPKRRWGGWNDDGSNLQFWMPKTNELRFEGVNVNVAASGITGGTRINTVNGNVKADGLTKRIELETVNGKIKSTNLEGKIRINTVNGEIHDKDSKGVVKFETVNGDINTNTRAQHVEINNVNGDMDLNLAKIKELEIGTVNGDIELDIELLDASRVFISTVGGDANITFRGDVSAEFNIEAHSGGDITNRLTKDKVKRDRYGPGESLRFKIGSGSSEVEIDTVGGDIRIE